MRTWTTNTFPNAPGKQCEHVHQSTEKIACNTHACCPTCQNPTPSSMCDTHNLVLSDLTEVDTIGCDSHITGKPRVWHPQCIDTIEQMPLLGIGAMDNYFNFKGSVPNVFSTEAAYATGFKLTGAFRLSNFADRAVYFDIAVAALSSQKLTTTTHIERGMYVFMYNMHVCMYICI